MTFANLLTACCIAVVAFSTATERPGRNQLGATAPPVKTRSEATEQITDLTRAVAEGKKTGKPIFVYAFDSV